MLEMRDHCERCDQPLAADGPAMICSFECTFCLKCSSDMEDTCPNCTGRLVARPPRTSASAAAAAARTGQPVPSG
jgi:uncharacterized protein